MARRNIKTNAVERRCILHSEDTKLIGPKLLENSPGGRYYERVRCLNGLCTFFYQVRKLLKNIFFSISVLY